MLAHKQYVTISDPAKMELTNLPFRKGQRVEVVMIAEDDDKSDRVDELRALFKKTQALPQAKAISEDMIAEEIEEYRAGR
jgi:antitoxin ParD1/3/4